ncbi:hypothetical protein GK109_09125 [Pseudarthrobacter sp. GA104]|nr:hypothetical protein [Pseudarthrobacter sp. GA104]
MCRAYRAVHCRASTQAIAGRAAQCHSGWNLPPFHRPKGPEKCRSICQGSATRRRPGAG